MNIFAVIENANTVDEVKLALLRVRLFLDDPENDDRVKQGVRQSAESLYMTLDALGEEIPGGEHE